MDDATKKSLKANERVVPESELKKAKARIRELERMLGKKTMEAEILQEAVAIAREKKVDLGRQLARRERWTVTAVAAALGISRPHLSTTRNAEPTKRSKYRKPDDEALLERIRPIVKARPSSGYRRVTAHLNRQPDAAAVNHKRVYRVMRQAGLLLAKYTGLPPRSHTGRIITLASDMRWCSDAFEIRCWNGERVYVAFSLDCCDREVIGWVAANRHLDAGDIRDLIAVNERAG